MSIAAYVILVFSFLAALALAALAAAQLLNGRGSGLNWLEYGHIALFSGLTAAFSLLLLGLVSGNFSLAYAAAHTDRALPLLYRICALWAGQEGSLLVWALAAASFCLVFQLSRAYPRLDESTRLMFWALHFLVMAFFLLLLITWSNPFTRLIPSPHDGLGLNPVLRHPGMILHPPLLLVGYAGLVLPACLAAAQSFVSPKGAEHLWIMLIRPYTLAAWLPLTAGIILGAWWSYMELGWGGYWAWDPVENASLVPWLLSTAFLHTAMLERNRKILSRPNVLLAGLALASTLTAAWLTRGGATASLHSFGRSPVSTPLFLAAIFSLALAVAAVCSAQQAASRIMPAPLSRDGLLRQGIWLLLALAAVILAATLAPTVSDLWSERPVGLTPAFYNRVCPPLFVALTALIFASFLREPHGPFPWGRAALHLAVSAIPLGLLLGTARPLSLLALIFSLAVIILGFNLLPKIWSAKTIRRFSFSAYAPHLGFAIMVLAVAASGPYKLEVSAALAPGRTVRLGDYAFTLREINQADDTFGRKLINTAHLDITGPGGRPAGTLAPTLVLHYKSNRAVATHEAAVLSSPGRDIYAVFIGRREDGKAELIFSLHPLINWLWIGGALMCLSVVVRLAGHKPYRRGRP